MPVLLQASRKRALGSLFSDQPLDIPDWQHGETRLLTVGKIESIGNQINARLFEPQDITNWTMRAALGKGFLQPVAGVFTITFGANTTGNIVYNPTAAQISTALNLLASVIAAGGVTVSGENGFFFFTFGSVGARAQMTGSATNLAPLSILDFGTLIEGSASLQEVQSLRILQNPGAYTSLTIASDPPSAGVSLVTTGGAGLNAKVRVSLTTRQSGLLVTGAQYTIVTFVAGDDFTNVGAGSNASGITFTASGTTPTTWTNGSALRRVDNQQPYDGQFTLLVRGIESVLIAYNASAADVVAALEGLNKTSGLLITGAKYKIVTFVAGDVFTNVGAGSNATGVVFVASGTTPTTWTNQSVLSPVAAGNVAVAREAEGQYLIAFQGDMANTAMGTITADGSSLRVVQTLSGTLDCRTSALDLILSGQPSTSIVFEIEGTPPGGTVQKLFRADNILRDSIIDPSDQTPPADDGYYYIGTEARLVPIADGVKLQVTTDGITWQDADSWAAT